MKSINMVSVTTTGEELLSEVNALWVRYRRTLHCEHGKEKCWDCFQQENEKYETTSEMYD